MFPLLPLYLIYCRTAFIIPPAITDIPVIIRCAPRIPSPLGTKLLPVFLSLDITKMPEKIITKPIVVALIGIENHLLLLYISCKVH